MSIEDLQQHGVLLPEDEWGTRKLTTTTSEIPLLLLFLAAAAGCFLTFWGGGNQWTWIGISLFFVAFFAIIVLCDRAIQYQNQRLEQERQTKHN